MGSSAIRAATGFLTIAVASTGLRSADWPHWRGPSRNGVVQQDSGWQSGLWPPKQATWQAQLGAGASAPVVAAGQVWALGWKAGRDTLHCLDAQTGKLIWQQSYQCPQYGRHSSGDKGIYSGPSACPSYDRDSGYLYTLSTDGDLICWDTRQRGQRVWSLNLYDKYDIPQRPLVGGRKMRDYGYTTAPLVLDDWVVVEVGDDEGNLMGFAKTTGQRIWASQSHDPAGHTGGPVPMQVGQIPCVAVLTINNLLVVRLDAGHLGETLAEFPWTTDFANSIATPAVQGNSVLITSEYNQYAIARIDVTASGAQLVWKQPHASGVCSPVIHKGHVYWCWRGVYCLDFATGKPLWRGGRFGATGSCLVTGDDRLMVWADRGELVLVDTAVRSPKRYTELSRKSGVFKRDVWPHLAVSDGRVFCRDRDGNMKCFALSDR
ncbi:MAG: PQQ-binding-like beta-propeller repeat protein [Planctomycetaceae bacterium]